MSYPYIECDGRKLSLGRGITSQYSSLPLYRPQSAAAGVRGVAPWSEATPFIYYLYIIIYILLSSQFFGEKLRRIDQKFGEKFRRIDKVDQKFGEKFRKVDLIIICELRFKHKRREESEFDMMEKQNDSMFFITDKSNIMISFSKKNFERKNTRDELNMYLLQAYLRFHCTVSGKVCSTLNAITIGCGNPIKGNSKEANERFRSALLLLQKANIIACDKDIRTLKNSEYFEIEILDDSIFHCDNNFVLLTMQEYETIIYTNTSTKKNLLLAIYLCVKKNVYLNDITSIPKLAVMSHEQIKNVTSVSSVTTIKTALAELHDMGLLYWDSAQYLYYDEHKKAYKPTRNAYALRKKDIKYTKTVLEDVYQTKICSKDEIDNKIGR